MMHRQEWHCCSLYIRLGGFASAGWTVNPKACLELVWKLVPVELSDLNIR